MKVRICLKLSTAKGLFYGGGLLEISYFSPTFDGRRVVVSGGQNTLFISNYFLFFKKINSDPISRVFK